MPQKKENIFFYKPYLPYLLVDVVLLLSSFGVVLWLFPLSTNIPFQKYWVFALVFSGVWLLTSYLIHRYVAVRFLRVHHSLLRLFATAGIVFGAMWGYMEYLGKDYNYSIWVLLTIWLIVLIFSFVFVLSAHAYRYALNIEPEIERLPDLGTKHVLYPAHPLTEGQKANIRQLIIENSGRGVLRLLDNQIDLYSSNTLLLRTSEIFNIQKINPYRYDTIINLMPLNQIRGINKMFGIINDRLPENGRLLICFESQSQQKQRILRSYPPVLNRLVYFLFYIYKRVIPRMFLTSRIYYDITEGKNRVLSKAEVLGRLCYCGYEIESERKRNGLIYVVARRSFRPKTFARRYYGVLIQLNRVGKDGKKIKVYKFRTMHPYSEFLQQYIYEKYSLQEGGKFKHDIRVSSMGRFMRRTWMDEWPMFINIMKGEMKRVGVRPLSNQYFSLYNEELQKQRTRHKPGLLPPFYVDMPKTLSEIEASEKKYLDLCEQKGTLRTDFVYFWKIFFNIVFRHKRSN